MSERIGMQESPGCGHSFCGICTTELLGRTTEDTICSNCDGVAVFWCQDCNLDFCAECFNISHQLKAFQNHTKLSTTQKSTLISYRDCEQHRPEKLKSFCRDCEVSVCIYCIIDQHKQHNVVAIENQLSDMKEVITETATKFLTEATIESAWNGIEEAQLERKKCLENEILELKMKLEGLEAALHESDECILSIREKKRNVITHSQLLIDHVQNISNYDKLISLNQKYVHFMQNIFGGGGDDHQSQTSEEDSTMFAIGEATKTYPGYVILSNADEINRRKDEMAAFYQKYEGFYVLDSFKVTNTFASKSKWLLSSNRNYMVPMGYIKRDYNLVQGSYKGICELHRRESNVFPSIEFVMDGGFYGRVCGIPALFVKDSAPPNDNLHSSAN